MTTYAFQNRETELNAILKAGGRTLSTIYGEGGIGKSALLKKAKEHLDGKTEYKVVFIDMANLAGQNRKQQFVELLEKSLGVFSGDPVALSPDEALDRLCHQVIETSLRTDTFIFIDTIEKIQNDVAFWEWLETRFISRLVVIGQARQVFAGRLPAPLRKYETRRAVRPMRLERLDVSGSGRSLAREAVQTNSRKAPDRQQVERMADLAVEFSFGHPKLTEELAVDIAGHSSQMEQPGFKSGLCSRVVRPYIENTLFDDMDDTWKTLLWWISALDWFDAVILGGYLGIVAPEIVGGKPDNFYIQGISRLRNQDFAIFQAESGDGLYGVLGHILLHCFEVERPADYGRALAAARQTFENLAGDFPDGDPEKEKLKQTADKYQARIEKHKQAEENA